MGFGLCKQAMSHLWTLACVSRLGATYGLWHVPASQEPLVNFGMGTIMRIERKFLLIILLKMHSIPHLRHWNPF